MNETWQDFKDNWESKTDLSLISFDAFYQALEENTSLGKGYKIGSKLKEKFKTAFQLPENKVPDGSQLNSVADLQLFMEQVETYRKCSIEQQQIIQKHGELRIQLVMAMGLYDKANLTSDAHKRAESLLQIKTILQPFFTDELKQEQPTLLQLPQPKAG